MATPAWITATIIVLLTSILTFCSCFNLHTSDEMMNATRILIDVSSRACDQAKDVIIIAKSGSLNQANRDAVRQTWARLAKQEFNIDTVFVMGRSLNQSVMHNISRESDRHQDILMGDFIDHYFSLTLKTSFLLRWINETCGSIKFLAYVDDDVAVNPSNLVHFLSRNLSHAIYGQKYEKVGQLRDPDVKHYVPTSVIPLEDMFDLAPGTGIIMSSVIAGQLFETGTREEMYPKLWIDDVFFYGLVGRAAGVPIMDEPGIRGFKSFDPENECFNDRYDEGIVIGDSLHAAILVKLWDREKTAASGPCRPVHTRYAWIAWYGVSLVILVTIMLMLHERSGYKQKTATSHQQPAPTKRITRNGSAKLE